MAKVNPKPNCKGCGNAFLKPHTRAIYCCRACAIFGKSTRQENGCLIWQGAKNDAGYGQINFAGKREYVHRIAYEEAKGPLGKNFVCHACDTPACINPEHLFSGDQAANMLDMAQKGRVGTARLKASDVRVIRNLHGSLPVQKIADAFKVSKSTIEDIIYRKQWKHVS